jgi:cysteinyl-tRNA synthetase
VGHLESDADEGEDKISKRAKLENLEPMEIVQKYSNDFHRVTGRFNLLDPDIEPSAIGHIQEQIKMIEKLVNKGLAYEVNGSVYFDVAKYNEKEKYGVLSGRVLEELMSGSRELDGQDNKRTPIYFALWKNASPTHIMRWESPWGYGFPGWHLECSVMSSKYLGESFDIHGGGLDLKFPHHECEIAQSVGANGQQPVKYWIHTNMLTVNGQKMSKSLGNSFLPDELFTGAHELLSQPYSPMTVRFFMLQSHYSSTLDFSDEALKAAAKGYKKIINGLVIARDLKFEQEDGIEINEKLVNQIESIITNFYRAMNDDFNTAKAIAQLFNLLKKINSIATKNLKPIELGEGTFEKLIRTYTELVEEVLGLKEEKPEDVDGIINILLGIYSQAKKAKEYDKVDEIRASLKKYGIVLKDMKDAVGWAYEE